MDTIVTGGDTTGDYWSTTNDICMAFIEGKFIELTLIMVRRGM